MDKTPQEIYEFKFTWLQGSYNVEVDELHEYACKIWCRLHCAKEDWHLYRYTDHYKHTFCFRYKNVAEAFSKFIDSLTK